MSQSSASEYASTNAAVRLALMCVAAAALVWLFMAGTQIFLPATFAFVIGVVFAPLADHVDRLGAPDPPGLE